MATIRPRKPAYVTACTHDIGGRALDWAVAAARKLLDPLAPHTLPTVGHALGQAGNLVPIVFAPSSCYAQGGPIMDEEGIETFRNKERTRWYGVDFGRHRAYGPDRLTAACRCIVLKHLGERVRVPVALLEDAKR